MVGAIHESQTSVQNLVTYIIHIDSSFYYT